MKTKKELESLKEEMAQLKSKLVELSDDELALVTGGFGISKPSIGNLPECPTLNLSC